MNVFDKLQKIYETDLKEFKEEQKELTAARTPIKGTVSPSKRLHLEPGLSIKEWLVWLEKDTKPEKKQGKANSAARNHKRKAAARSKPKPHTTKRTDHPKRPTDGPGMEQRITAYLQTRGSEFTTVQELLAQLKTDNIQVVRLVLGKMAKQERVEKNADGRVRLVKKAA